MRTKLKLVYTSTEYGVLLANTAGAALIKTLC